MNDSAANNYAPLAERVRPNHVDEVLGQSHLLQASKPLYRALAGGHLHSMILWGPPGTGKTTLARLASAASDAHLLTLSAVSSGVKDIRSLVAVAEQNARLGRRSILFIDEIHRFNKAQQDAFLPYVENGTVTLIGATTENPSFELNNALLSRARVYVLQAISEQDIATLCIRATTHENGLPDAQLSEQTALHLASLSDGDARRALNLLETAYDLAQARDDNEICDQDIEQVAVYRSAVYDKGGDHFYDQISALHKSIRGSNPDAAVYWITRMLAGGCDPHYIARRLLRIAYEDIGLADPRAPTIALEAWQSYDRLGAAEGEYSLTHAAIYLAITPKSNETYMAHKRAVRAVNENPSATVPNHLRNAPTKLAQSMGHGENYRYSHNEAERFSAGQTYFPDELGELELYESSDSGAETRFNQRLNYLRQLNADAKN